MPRRRPQHAAEVKTRVLAICDIALVRVEKKVRRGQESDEDLARLKLLAGIVASLEDKVPNLPATTKKAEKALTPAEVEALLGK